MGGVVGVGALVGDGWGVGEWWHGWPHPVAGVVEDVMGQLVGVRKAEVLAHEQCQAWVLGEADAYVPQAVLVPGPFVLWC